jgi:hypothetical protein
LKNFSGRVELYDLQGRSLGKSTLVNGELAQEKATLAVTECIYEFYMATELLGYTTYNYRLKSCSTTLYGDTGGNNHWRPGKQFKYYLKYIKKGVLVSTTDSL